MWQEETAGEQGHQAEDEGMRTWGKKNKYNAQKAESVIYKELAGRRFDSKLERDRAEDLVLLQRGKEIRKLEFQSMVYLTDARISYRADFFYEERIAPRKFRKVWEDAKGFESTRWNMIKKLWAFYGPGLLRVTMRGRGGRIGTVKEIIPK